MKLHNYFRSSSSFRVRIALALKGLPYEYVAVHIARGAHKKPPYVDLSADTLVPLLEVNGHQLSQSMAIIEYLDDTHPTPALLPADPLGRAQVRALAQSIACEIHPINNLRVLKKVVADITDPDEATRARFAWFQHWAREGLLAFERQLDFSERQRAVDGLGASTFCYGNTPTLADCCLVPQIFNGRRFEVSMAGLTRTQAVFDECMKLPAFQAAQPSACPDFEA